MTKVYNSRHIRYVTVDHCRYNWRGVDQGVKQFATLDDAVRWIGADVLKLRSTQLFTYHTSVFAGREWTTRTGTDSYVVRDDGGLIIPVWKLQEVYSNLPWIEEARYPRWERRYKNYDPETNFRKTPVPGIHRRCWHRAHRRLQTTQERRENNFVNLHDEDCLEHHIKARGARSPKNLPTWWDDIPSSRQGNSWKRYRNTRWKEDAVSYRTLNIVDANEDDL